MFSLPKCMNKTKYLTVKSEKRKVPIHQTFFPRIIREFDDGADEKPMIYWGRLE